MVDQMTDEIVRRDEHVEPSEGNPCSSKHRKPGRNYIELLRLEQDAQGNWTSRYYEHGKADHYAHAEKICAGAVNPNASTLLHEIDRSARPAGEVAMYVIGRCDAQLRASVEYLPESPLTQSQRRKEIKEGSHLLAVQQGVSL